MATSIFFNGRRINVPQAVSKIDASALSSVSPSAVGIVALVGTAEGGEPLTVADANDMTRAGQVFDKYRSGDLRVASLFAFEPSTDEAIPGGAQRIIPVKVNPATQSVVTLLDALAADAADLTSRDWGAFTESISIQVADGTNQGKLITIDFEGEEEIIDDVGGEAVFTLLYTPGTGGYDTITAQITATQFISAASKSELGLDGQMTATVPGSFPSQVDVVSDNAGDTTQFCTIYGTVAGVADYETVPLTGTSLSRTTKTFSKVFGAVLDVACVGTVQVQDVPGGLFITSFAPGTLTRGVVQLTSMPFAGFPTLSIDLDAAFELALFGENSAGATVGEIYDMTTGNTTPVTGTVSMTKGTVLALGDIPAARTVTLTANAALTNHSTFGTISKLVSYLNTLDGMTATSLVSNPTTFKLTDMDYAAATSILSVTASLYADLYFFIKALNDNSAYISAARATGATGAPANTSGAVFLSGGSEGTTTITEWQQAFELLRKRRANIIVPLTRDPAVHALLATHLVERAGKLRSEANGYIGLGTVDGAGETLSNIKSQIQIIQTRHISAIPQEMQRFDPDTGEATWYPPHMLCAISAGMQAGSPIGEPLTRKRPLVTDIRNDSSWSIENDVEAMIDFGAMVFEKVDGVGIRCVRSITTHLADDNVVFTEMSANESANTCVFELRTALERKIGQRALAGTAAAIKGLANDVLGRLIDDEIIVAYRSLQVEQIGDVFPVSVEVAPVLPINFIPITVHLVAVRAAA